MLTCQTPQRYAALAANVNRERDRAKPGEGDGQRDAPKARGGAIRWPPQRPERGRVRQSGPVSYLTPNETILNYF
jgi:hypothetical protein